MKLSSLAELRKIAVRMGVLETRDYTAWCLNDFGAIHHVNNYYIIHLPSGMNLPWKFRKLDQALGFCQGLSQMKNTWRFITAEEMEALGSTLKDLAVKHSAIEWRKPKGQEAKEIIGNLNGYAQ